MLPFCLQLLASVEFFRLVPSIRQSELIILCMKVFCILWCNYCRRLFRPRLQTSTVQRDRLPGMSSTEYNSSAAYPLGHPQFPGRLWPTVTSERTHIGGKEDPCSSQDKKTPQTYAVLHLKENVSHPLSTSRQKGHI